MRICLGLAGRPCHTRTRHPRCPACQAEWTRRRRILYGGDWERFSRAARAAQPWCSICGATEDLTFDHEHWQVECRQHNSGHRRNA